MPGVADNQRVSTSDYARPEPTIFNRIYAALPQTQCTRCGYPDCAAYAHAIADGTAQINQCPPGGQEGIARLSAITGAPVLTLNPAHGAESPRFVAVIDEAWCIGCTLCLPVCPTDAILGGNKMMHVVVEAACTGCELCIPVCPVDCISLENVTGERTGWAAWSEPDAQKALKRYDFHSARYRMEADSGTKTLKNNDNELLQASGRLIAAPGSTETADKKRSVIEAALARARAARQLKP